MQPIKSISIPQPCHENWNKMTPVEQGRHCIQCNKTVTDFTAMTNNEIVSYFLGHGNVCGRFDSNQLTGLNSYLAVQDKPGFSWKKFTIAAAVTSLFATTNANAQRTLGKVRISQTVNPVKKAPADTTFKVITGKVVASDDGQPLPGAIVKLLKGETATSTNINGEYKLEIPANADTLVVSYIGFQTQKIQLDQVLLARNVTMMMDSTKMIYGVVGGVYIARQPFYKRAWNAIKRIFN